jgi:hypothetical protein
VEFRTRLCRTATLGVLILLAAACTKPLPPLKAVGDPVTGVNPVVPRTTGEQTKAVSYGPWTAPAATGAGHAQSGMIDDVRLNIEKPCTNCYITAAAPQLKYLDGTVANTDTGLWLHHFALFSSGGLDATCSLTAVQLLGERFFVGANERTQGSFPANVGYPVRATDSWALLVDLMNTSMTAKPVVFEMTWKWVPASTPDMRVGKPVWIDVNKDCGNSPFPAGTGVYSRKNTWTVTTPGRIMGLAGHLHDGATHITLRNVTTGQLLCDSQAQYGGPGFEEPGGGHGGDHGGDHGGGHGSGVHLSALTQCVSQALDHPLAVIQAGQVLEIEAFYDADAHPQVPGEEIMGVFIMYVVR